MRKMERLKFDNQGKLMAIDGKSYESYTGQEGEERGNNYGEDRGEQRSRSFVKLRTSQELDFLKEDKDEGKKAENIFDNKFWSLYSGENILPPLKFSNGKTQEDVVREIHDLIKNGKKIIFLHGACGTGKSAIALNLARVFGRTSVVVPVKTLQTQYEKDYTDGKYLIKNGKKMKIAMLTGRENHDSLIKSGASCADPFLPDTIKLTEKNYNQIVEYYKENPLIKNKEIPNIEKIRRIAIAPANPYWSPIISSDYAPESLIDAKKYEYPGCDGKKYIFYHRKEGCSYYDQYLAYKRADVIIFNSAKYNSELSLGRKPLTEIDVIDEADVYLDNFFEQNELNLTWLSNSLKNLNVESFKAAESIDKIRDLIELEEKNKRALGIDEAKIFKIDETQIHKILQAINADTELQSEIALDEMNYANKILEIAHDFSDSLAEVYVNFRREDDSLFVKIVSTNLSYKFKDLLSKTKALVFMSGTLHSSEVLKHIFQIKDYEVVEAETLNPGTMEIVRTGKEFDCKYINFSSGNYSRGDYLSALKDCVAKAETPTLIHVQAYQDLPNFEERADMNLTELMPREELLDEQREDKFGLRIAKFKRGEMNRLFSTKCSRGVDFPGDICKSMVFTKYPNPNVKDIFWKVIEKTHPSYYWEFYRDKAKREFLQRLFRAIRSKDDHVFVLSPDIRVLQEVQKMQKGS